MFENMVFPVGTGINRALVIQQSSGRRYGDLTVAAALCVIVPPVVTLLKIATGQVRHTDLKLGFCVFNVWCSFLYKCVCCGSQ